jgi:hypothetical protein
MNTPRIYVEYEVWDARTGNLIAFFETADKAFAELSSWVDQVGESVLSDLYLGICPYSPDLDDEASLELIDDEEWIGPGISIIPFLDLMRRAESPKSTWKARGYIS